AQAYQIGFGGQTYYYSSTNWAGTINMAGGDGSYTANLTGFAGTSYPETFGFSPNALQMYQQGSFVLNVSTTETILGYGDVSDTGLMTGGSTADNFVAYPFQVQMAAASGSANPYYNQ